MTVATTPDFKSPGVTSYVAHLIKFIKIVNGRQVTHNFSWLRQSTPLEKSNNYNILPVTLKF